MYSCCLEVAIIYFSNEMKLIGREGQKQAACELLEQMEKAMRQYVELGIQDIVYKPPQSGEPQLKYAETYVLEWM